MIEIFKIIVTVLLGFSSGVVISGAVFAFITVVGVVPTIANKTGTSNQAKFYEEAIMIGGILGCVGTFFDLSLPLPSVVVIVLGFCTGVFYGILAVSLAEVLNVIPILTRRFKLGKGMFFFILAIALGKLFGSVLHVFFPNIFKME
jgi:stage V sporulation protein AB